jgi:tetratricopeptide (TPR) repeat protein
MTANRFGTDHFKGNYGDHKTVICAPSKGANCAACASHSGDFTLAAGSSITLRHRFYFHHGDAQSAQVAARYDEYAADKDSTVIRMRFMFQDRRWKELLEKFGAEDFAAWPAESLRHGVDALQVRGQTYSFAKDGPRAEADLHAAMKLAPRNPDIAVLMGDNYINNLNDEAKAIAAYRQVIEFSGANKMGWQPLTATVSLARLYTDQVKLDAALEVLKPFGDLTQLPFTWRIKLLRSYGHLYAAQGKEAESLAKFREALSLETQP